MKITSQTKCNIELTQAEVKQIIKHHLEQHGVIDSDSEILSTNIPEQVEVVVITKISRTDSALPTIDSASTGIDVVEVQTEVERSSTIPNATLDPFADNDDISPNSKSSESLSSGFTQSLRSQSNESLMGLGKRMTEDLFKDG